MNLSRSFFVLTFIFFSVSFISAICEEGQIDINSASIEELDQITHVGPAIGQRIIDNRPFSSIDEIVDVSGISEGYVADIKSQGLACVIDGNEEINVEEESSNETAPVEEVIIEETTPKNIELPPIELKSAENSEDLSKDNYPVYGLIGFSVLIIVLLALKNRNRKNELA